jgi:hypothetical protein
LFTEERWGHLTKCFLLGRALCGGGFHDAVHQPVTVKVITIKSISLYEKQLLV